MRGRRALEGDELELVDAAEGVGHGADADHEHLGEGLAVGLDVVGASEDESNGPG